MWIKNNIRICDYDPVANKISLVLLKINKISLIAIERWIIILKYMLDVNICIYLYISDI